MKKILSITVIGLFIGCSFGAQGVFFKQSITEASGTTITNLGNFLFDQKMEILMKLSKFPSFSLNIDGAPDDCGCNDQVISSDLSQTNNKLPPSVDCSNDDFPEYFNWRDHEGKDWTTPVKSQYMGNGPLPRRCGSCMVFAAIGALESVIKIREGYATLTPDLSEQYVLSCLPAAGYPYGKGCSGGNGQKVFECIISTTEEGNFHNGVPLESCFPYQAKDVSQGVTCDQKCSDWLEYLVPLSDHGFTIIEGVLENTPESRELIKNMIMQHGPIMAGMETTLRYLLWGLTHHSPEDYLPYRGLKWRNSVNHAVTIVGWKDDSSIANGGYWICKNTIGTFFADEGFFNIEYGALFIGVAVVWADYDPASFDWPPNIPTIKGSTSGTAGVEYTFTFATIDPDGNDDVCYSIDWGDGANSGWLGPFDAGSGCTVSHSWEGNGDYEIKGRAKDPNGLVSEWSQSFVVGITKDRVEDTEFNRLLYRCPRLFPLVQLILDLSFNNFKEIP